MRLIILGGPGSGKGTQLGVIQSELDVVGISVGEILRRAIADNSFLGAKVKPCVAQGELVDDDLMVQVIRLRFLAHNMDQGWILEGYPRTTVQAEELDFMLDDFNQSVDYALYLDVPEAVMLERSLARSRPDDTPDILHRRIKRFHEQIPPILEYYGSRGKLLHLDASRDPKTISAEILQNLKP
ncbi:nucleoside monophosphate kinase [Spirulina major CS-329]|uniref:adenylate kinase family protein n=1 Tax=Spirulina TaxID=1154 RepID=UPI00232F4ABF|nr:nucleoside monophosphate kinase [Spirulina major]MDB9495040.1 nucleoside monophosphate kinase [Spirulina subsalsa CS-330]MDB9504217.1 nucleoside monophosphate kinase [Spirulina major CS-329]